MWHSTEQFLADPGARVSRSWRRTACARELVDYRHRCACRVAGSAIGTWAASTTVITIIGPVLGGFLANAGLWRGVFFINIPLAIGSLYALWRWVPETRDAEAKPLDVLGTALVALSLASLCFGAVQVSHSSLREVQTGGSLLLGILGLGLFTIYEAHSDHALIPLGLFRSKTFSGTNGVTLLLYGALSMTLFMLPIVLI
jgi:hypothetical protein